MEHCYICRRPLLEIEVCSRVLPVAQHRGVMVGQYPSFLSSTSYAPVSLCLACDVDQEQQITVRTAKRKRRIGNACLGLLLIFSIGDLVKGQNQVIAILGLLFIGGCLWKRHRTARPSITRSKYNKGGHYGKTQSIDSQ
jgi:hypothetical protein